MAQVLPPQHPTTTSPSPSSPTRRSQPPTASTDSQPTSNPQLLPPQRDDHIDPKRTSQHSRSSQHSTRVPSASLEYPAFDSSLPYALVRDFAYPVFHPLHYGAALDPSRSSTPISEWNTERRRSDPMEAWNHPASVQGGWTAGPWGGDGVMYGDPEHDDGLAALPSTSFSGGGAAATAAAAGWEASGGGGAAARGSGAGAGAGDDELRFKQQSKHHRKSKSYGNIADFERGRRRESGRRSRGEGPGGGGDAGGIFWFQGQPGDPSRRVRGHSGAGQDANGARRDSPFAAAGTATLPSRSFHTSSNHDSLPDEEEEEQIPLDTEPHNGNSPQRDSMGPEDEELFAGPSLALYSFEPENSNELRLDEGQEIMVSYRHGQGWLVASDPQTGEQGLVPEAYVRLIADMPNYDPERGEFVDLDEFEDIDSSEFPLDHEAEEWSNEVERHAQAAMDETDVDGEGATQPEGRWSTAHERNARGVATTVANTSKEPTTTSRSQEAG